MIFIVWFAFMLLQQKTWIVYKVCENKDFCNVMMASEDTKISEFDQYQKSHTALFFIYADLESITEKIDGCKNNLEKSSTAKVWEHIPSGLSMLTKLTFRRTEKKYDA